MYIVGVTSGLCNGIKYVSLLLSRIPEHTEALKPSNNKIKSFVSTSVLHGEVKVLVETPAPSCETLLIALDRVEFSGFNARLKKLTASGINDETLSKITLDTIVTAEAYIIGEVSVVKCPPEW